VEMFKNIRRVYDLHTSPMILSIPRDGPDGEAFPMNSIASVQIPTVSIPLMYHTDL
jgi:hypothetical protein